MTRSMRWISSSALSSLESDCVGLPQPRSRIAFAAATRAGGVALLLRMIPTRTFSAVRVCERASERISVTALGILWTFRAGIAASRLFVVDVLRVVPRHVFARRGVGVIHHEIVRLHGEAKRSWSFIRAAVARSRREWDDNRAHGNTSDSRTRINPEIASAIRQAVAAMRVVLHVNWGDGSGGGALQRRLA